MTRFGDLMLRGTLVMLALFLTTSPVVATAQNGLTPRQNELFLTALSADGWLTEQMHHDFWADVPKEISADPEQIAAIRDGIERAAKLASGFQREAWASMRLSIQAKKASFTSEYTKERDRLLASSVNDEQRQQFQASVRNAEAMVQAAGTGAAFQSSRGPMYVTDEMIENVLSGLEGSMFRVRQLGTHEWKSPEQERSYPDLHLRILWAAPLRLSSQLIETEGQQVQIKLLSSQVSADERVQIGFMELPNPWPDPVGGLQRTAMASLSSAGIERARAVGKIWRGRRVADAEGSAQTSIGAVHVSVRMVEAPEHHGVWQIFAASTRSLPDAGVLVERVENSLQLDAR